MIIYTILRFSRDGGMPPSSKRATLAAIWTTALLSSVVLAEMHWAAAIGVVGMAAIGTLAILCAVRTVPERASDSGFGRRLDRDECRC